MKQLSLPFSILPMESGQDTEQYSWKQIVKTSYPTATPKNRVWKTFYACPLFFNITLSHGSSLNVFNLLLYSRFFMAPLFLGMFIIWVCVIFTNEVFFEVASAQERISLSCRSDSLPEPHGRHCDVAGSLNNCATFALLYANSYYSSLSNLTLYLGLNKSGILDANGLSKTAETLLRNQPLLIPIDCQCKGRYFQAWVTKTAIGGETFEEIAASLEGLASCQAIQQKNPNLSPWGLNEKAQVVVPLTCACPAPAQLSRGMQLLLSVPICEGDSVSKLASIFNTSVEAILSANNIPGTSGSDLLVVNSTLLIPLPKKPILAPLLRYPVPDSDTIASTSIPVLKVSKHRSRGVAMSKLGIYIGVSGAVLVLGVATFVIVLVLQQRRRMPNLGKKGDVELQQLRIKNPRELKEEPEDPQDPPNDENLPYTPRNGGVDTYSREEIRRATEDFNSSNFIEGTMFHGCLNGKNLAIRQTNAETISKLDFQLLDENHHHPNIVRLLGTCIGEGSESYLVFEYARNGSLKDWLHGGLAMKSQFIASCYCFLSWSQRLRICLNVAMALHYMHHTMTPSYVHRSIKSRNILLDEEFNAKVGNFGMAFCAEDESEDPQAVLSSWSRGYLAPEYLQHGTVSPSIDIFAYGVVLLEVLSGQTPTSRSIKKCKSVKLLEMINPILESDDEQELRNFMDSALGEAYSFEAAMAVAKLAKGCVVENPSVRPSAEELVEKLARLVEDLPVGEQISVGGSSSKA